MKRVTVLLLLYLVIINPVFAINETDFSDILNEDEFEKPIILEPSERKSENEGKISPYTRKALKGIVEKEYSTDSAEGMFHEQLKMEFNRGIIKDTGFQANFINNLTDTISDKSNFKFNPQLINIGIKGNFKSEYEGYNLLFDVTPNIHENFFHRLVLDAWIETKRIPHHTILFGTSRPNVGYEGGMSPYLIPFISRSQSARTFGNIRKTGVRLKGDYKYIDYDIGGYSSDTWYSEFFPGVEADLWVNFKPLANVSEKTGNLNLGGGLQAGGRNSHDFLVASAALRYDYKKFWLRAEYANADGYNGGGGLSGKKAWGYNLTLAYRLTKKIEFLLRFDDFDPDKTKKNNNNKEYTLGINYFILGQAARIMLNYVFAHNDLAKDSHKIILGTQFLL